MATQSAIISIGFARSVTAKKAGIASASLLCGALEAANQYAGGSGLLGSTKELYRLPGLRVPFGDVQSDGSVMIRKVWYDVFDYVINRQLGGSEGPTLSDITATVASTRTSAIEAQSAVADVTQTVNANAVVLQATVEVSQASSLPGAAQIPSPIYAVKGVPR